MLAGLRPLIWLILRRDRFKLPVWIASVSLSLLAMVPLLKDVYGDAASLESVHQSFSANPAGLFLTGPMDAATFGAFMTIETVLWWGLAIAFMNTLFVVRHTRQNEEMGAQELILSGRTHRATGLVATLIVAFFANVLLALLMGVGLNLMNSSFSGADLWLYGAAFGIFGMVWATVAAIVAQLVESARTANGILASLIGATFLLRGIGDFMGNLNSHGAVDAAWPSLLSPFGWMQSARALTFPEWSSVLLPILFVVAALPVAFILLNHRDIGAGIIPSRRGRARASWLLRTLTGVTWKLQKNIFTGWLIGVVVMAVTVGSLVPMMGSVYEESEQMQQMIIAMGGKGEIVPSFLAAMLSIMVLMSLAYVLQALGKARYEETAGHLENLLSTRVSRLRWLGLHGGVAIVGGIILPVVASITMAVCVNAASDVTVNVNEYALAGLTYAPVVLFFAGLYVLLLGMWSRGAGLVTWVYFGFVLFALWIAPLLQLEDWMMNMSVMSYLPAVPVEPIAWTPVIVLSGISIALLCIGFISFSARDTE